MTNRSTVEVGLQCTGAIQRLKLCRSVYAGRKKTDLKVGFLYSWKLITELQQQMQQLQKRLLH